MTPIIQIRRPATPRPPATPCGGCILFDVGVGRTFTAARHTSPALVRERLRRPVILAPRSIQGMGERR
jgi:hypothetical protein